MATWKKLIVSGSSISQLANDANLIYSNSADVSLTGSYSGSFTGDGSGLTGVVASGTISSSAQIADDISGSLGANATLIRSLDAATISGSFTSTSASIATDIKALEDFSSSLDAGFVTEAELVTATASLSASLATDIAALDSFSSSLSSTIISYTGSFSGNGSALTNITVDQNATVTASFSNASTASITHNFDSDNIIVSAYDADGYQFIPGQVFLKTNDVVELHFEAATTGKAVVARGGHIVSGSIPFDNILGKPTLVSGSAQLAADISGSSTSLSSSLAGRITTAEAELGNTLISGAAQIASEISGSSTALSASVSTRLTTAESELGNTLLSSSAQIAGDISGSLGANATLIRSLTAAGISGSFTATSASIASDIAGISTTFTVDANSGTADDIPSGETLTFTGAGPITTAVSANEITIDVSDATISGSFTSTSSSIAANIATLDSGKADKTAITGAFSAASASFSTRVTDNEGDLAAIESYTSSLKTALTLDGQNVTVVGNLEVSGTTTQIDSTTVDIGDNIIQLNGTGASKGGIAVNDVTAPTTNSGSLLWDGANDYWVAGATGSESKIFTAGGNDGLLSGSAQIAADISGSVGTVSASIASDIVTKADKTAVSGAFGTVSSSLASRITANEAFSASLDDTFTTTAELNTATASLSSSVAADIATNLASITTLNGKTLVSGSSQIGGDISGSLGANATLIRSLTAAGISGSLGANADLIRSLDAATISGSSTQLSASIAADISGLEQSKITTGSHEFKVSLDTGSAVLVSSSAEILEFGDIYNQGNGSVDFRVPGTANYIELNHGDSDFIFLDGTDAGINLDNTYEWRFYGATGTMIAPGEIRGTTISGSSFVLSGGELFSGSAQLNTISGVAGAISGSFTSTSASIATDIKALEDFSSSLDASFATEAELNTATASLSSSIATDIATLTSGKADKTAVSGAFTATSASIASDIAAQVVASGSFSTRVTAQEAFSSSLDTTFATEAELNTATASLSSSLAADIATNLGSINTINGKTIVSASVLDSTGQGEVRLTTNGVAASAVDLGLQASDSPTFAGMTITGDLTVTGNTIEAQVTNLAVEDKFILLNSGSAAGDAGIVVDNTGTAFGWDNSAGRWAFDFTGATANQTALTTDAFVAAVVTTDDSNYQKVGNIRIDGDDIYIYS